ncbi:hypothetical protein Q0Z83_017610 [Actinoplanes sichuanensis]|uniref:WD40 repeat protein n=1 Tax=Actinoplanes sichuanensis TaxID=512349 RepID=A0ABW4A8J9_9ACTN|nr:hypothetical protein [Actinoplanes sichuanensis]BEL03570.1 hypothetical protein Q0Z83_017610 [Actinoplanes sichuanensis]
MTLRRLLGGRKIRAAAAVVLGVVAIALPLFVAMTDKTQRDTLLAVTGIAVSLTAAGLSVWSHFFRTPAPERSTEQQVNDLADIVSAEWRAEASTRLLDSPGVLPLRWSYDGDERTYRFEGRFDDFAGQLASVFATGNQRLLILGEPGAGKTVLAIMLVLGLIEARRPGAATPVLLTVSSWDPLSEKLTDWLDRTLGTVYYGGRREIPAALRHERLVIPVLDGLDEMPESARRSAVAAINEALGGDEAIVLTCRTAEYLDVIAGGSANLVQAPVINVQPVAVAEAITYLQRVAWPRGTDWTPAFAAWTQNPGGPFAAALSTPLMISVARTVYERGGGRPCELLTVATRHAVEDHLLDRLVDAAYVPRPGPDESALEHRDQARIAAPARRYLTELAQYLHTHGKRELAWWEMSRSLLSPWAGPLIGLAGGLLMMIFTAACYAVAAHLGPQDTSEISDAAVAYGTFCGVIFAIGTTLIWYTTATATPGMLSFRLRGSAGRLRSGFVNGAALIAVPAVPLFAVSGAIPFVIGGPDLDTVISFTGSAAVAVAVAALLGLATAAQRWLHAPIVHAAQADPAQYLRQDRRSTLAGAALAGLISAVGFAPLLVCALVLGGAAGRAVTGWPGVPASFDWRSLVHSTVGEADPWHSPEEAVVLIVTPGLIVATWSLSTRAWTKFLVMRFMLAMQRRLPWRLFRFLIDARQRQLVRYSSGCFQFRHVRLQEHLANRTRPVAHRTTTTGSVLVRRSAFAAVVIVLVALPVLQRTLPHDGATAVLTGHHSPIEVLAFSEDGSLLASGDSTGAIMLWTTREPGRLLRPLSPAAPSPDSDRSSLEHRVTSLTFAHGGHSLISVSDTAAYLWDVQTGTKILSLPNPESIRYASFSPRGDYAVAHYSDRFRIWHADGRPTPLGEIRPEGSPLVEFSSDDTKVAVAGTEDNRVTIRRTASGSLVEELPILADEVSSITYSPDDEVLAVGAGTTVRLWRQGGGWLDRPIIHTYGIGPVTFNKTSEVLMTTDGDSRVLLRHSRPGSPIQELNDIAAYPPPMFSPDGSSILSFDDGGDARLFEALTGRPLTRLAFPCSNTSYDDTLFSPDGHTIVTNHCEGLQTWNAADGHLLTDLVGHLGGVRCIAMDPRGEVLASGGYDTSIRLWRLP